MLIIALRGLDFGQAHDHGEGGVRHVRSTDTERKREIQRERQKRRDRERGRNEETEAYKERDIDKR